MSVTEQDGPLVNHLVCSLAVAVLSQGPDPYLVLSDLRLNHCTASEGGIGSDEYTIKQSN